MWDFECGIRRCQLLQSTEVNSVGRGAQEPPVAERGETKQKTALGGGRQPLCADFNLE